MAEREFRTEREFRPKPRPTYRPRPPSIIGAEACARKLEPLEACSDSRGPKWLCEGRFRRRVFLGWDHDNQHYFQEEAPPAEPQEEEELEEVA